MRRLARLPIFATSGGEARGVTVAGTRAKSASRRAGQPDSAWGDLLDGDLVVVDSAPLIYMLDDHRDFAPLFLGLFELHAQGRVRIALSTVTIAEVLVGPLRHGQEVLARRYEKALAGFEVVPVSHEIAVGAARVRAITGLRMPDALQAATALDIGASALVTHDRDFSRLTGLRVLFGRPG